MTEDDRTLRTLSLIGAVLLSVASFSLLSILWSGIESLALFLVRIMPHSVLSAMSGFMWLLPLALVLMATPLFVWVKARKET